MNFDKEEIVAACREYGPQIVGLPVGIDGAQLLWAMSGNESSFGANCAPRHEPAFDVDGVYGSGPVMTPLLAKFGSAAACSYGPWQIMFCNAPIEYTPDSFNSLDNAAHATVVFLNRMIVRWKPENLAEIGECWNGGHVMQHLIPAVAAYVQRLIENYAVEMPTN